MNLWIIERLDRKLADVMDSNIVEKCDATLSRTIQSLTSPVLRVLFFTISVFDFTDCPCFEVKDEEDLAKKAQPKFQQINHKKTGNHFIIFITVLTISFLLSYKLSECLIL